MEGVENCHISNIQHRKTEIGMLKVKWFEVRDRLGSGRVHLARFWPIFPKNMMKVKKYKLGNISFPCHSPPICCIFCKAQVKYWTTFIPDDKADVRMCTGIRRWSEQRSGFRKPSRHKRVRESGWILEYSYYVINVPKLLSFLTS